MATDMYAMGYRQFLSAPIPENQIKSNPPQWRAGYRAAEQDHAAKNKVALVTEKVHHNELKTLTITWPLIQLVTRTPRFHVFAKRPQLEPIRSMITHKLWDKRETFHGLVQLENEALRLFDSVLQWGYDEGNLTAEDCELHGYNVRHNKDTR